jgi:hypothetical protein
MQKNTTAEKLYYVEVIGGKAVLVLAPTFPDGGIDALESAWINEGFPTEEGVWSTQPAWERSELEDETRLFLVPTDGRLKVPYTPLDQVERDDYAHSQEPEHW